MEQIKWKNIDITKDKGLKANITKNKPFKEFSMKSLAKPSLVMLFGLSLQACDIKLKNTHIDVTQKEITEATLAADQVNDRAKSELEKLKKTSLDGKGKVFWNSNASTGLYYSGGLEVRPAKVEVVTDCQKYFTFGGGCEVEKDRAVVYGGGLGYAGNKKITVVSADRKLKVCNDQLEAAMEAVFGNNSCQAFNVGAFGGNEKAYDLIKAAAGSEGEWKKTKDSHEAAISFVKRMP